MSLARNNSGFGRCQVLPTQFPPSGPAPVSAAMAVDGPRAADHEATGRLIRVAVLPQNMTVTI